MPIKELWLKDAGPFDEITFTFDPQVNVFIGPNNSGKSTVLAALAAIAVQSFQFPHQLEKTEYGGRCDLRYFDEDHIEHAVGGGFVLFGPEGEDEMNLRAIRMRRCLGHTTYVSALRLNSDTRVSGITRDDLSIPKELQRAINAESNKALQEYSKSVQRPLNPIEDPSKTGETYRNEMLALETTVNQILTPYNDLVGDIRKRISGLPPTYKATSDEDLLQLFVNLDYKSYRENQPGIRRVIDSIFELSSEITEGFSVSFAGIDEDTEGLLLKVKTPDGELPFNALSQGTQSMVQWLSHLILGYAMYYDFAEDFAEKPGVLIIDEIDAHLHPSWQRRILPALTKHFPNLQIFCATHSPLLIAGLKAGQIQLLKRKEGGGISVTTNENDIVGWSADEILSCFLDIPNPTDLKTDQDLQRLEELQLKRERTPEEEKERQELREKVPEVLANGPPPKQITELMESLHEILKKRGSSEGASKKTTPKQTRKSA